MISLVAAQALTDTAEMRRQLALLDAEEARVELELSTLCKRTDAALREGGSTVQAYLDEVGDLQPTVAQLARTIDPTARLAATLSSRVKALDVQQSRVRTTLAQVDDMQALLGCVSAVNVAMHSSELEAAATHLSRFLGFEPAFAELALRDAPSPVHGMGAADFLRAAQRRVVESCAATVASAFAGLDAEAAVAVGPELARALRILPLVGEAELGLHELSRYAAEQLRRQCRRLMEAAHAQYGKFAELCGRIFEAVALLADSQQPLLDTHYGRGRTVALLAALQETACKQALLLLGSFADLKAVDRRVASLPQLLQQQQQKPAEPGAEEEVRELDALAEQIAAMSQKAQLFRRFLRARHAQYLHSLAESLGLDADEVGLDSTEEDAAPGTAEYRRWREASDDAARRLQQHAMVAKFNELLSVLVLFEDALVRLNVRKAIRIDRYEPGEHTSSCVDDVFFILKKALTRAMATLDLATFGAIVNLCNRCIEEEYIAVLERRLAASVSAVVTTISGSGAAESRERRLTAMILLNNIEVSCEYLVRLQTELEHEATRQFAAHVDADGAALAKIRTNLSVFTDTAATLQQMLLAGRKSLSKNGGQRPKQGRSGASPLRKAL